MKLPFPLTFRAFFLSPVVADFSSSGLAENKTNSAQHRNGKFFLFSALRLREEQLEEEEESKLNLQKNSETEHKKWRSGHDEAGLACDLLGLVFLPIGTYRIPIIANH